MPLTLPTDTTNYTLLYHTTLNALCFDTFSRLLQATKASNHSVIAVQVLEYVFDISKWISPHLDQIRYHTKPHIFRFAKNERGQLMFYKLVT